MEMMSNGSSPPINEITEGVSTSCFLQRASSFTTKYGQGPHLPHKNLSIKSSKKPVERGMRN
jgi:hypothetical protein